MVQTTNPSGRESDRRDRESGSWYEGRGRKFDSFRRHQNYQTTMTEPGLRRVLSHQAVITDIYIIGADGETRTPRACAHRILSLPINATIILFEMYDPMKIEWKL